MNLASVTRRHVDRPVTATRSVVVDSVRGLAIVLMVLDHVLVQLDPYSFLRSGSVLSITRLSLPLFMLAAAAVWRPATGFARWRLLPVVLVEMVVYVWLGMGQPGIVQVILLCFIVLDVAHWVFRRIDWYVVAVLGLLQALYVPLSQFEGYQPGLVLAWFALGCLGWMRAAAPIPRWLTPSWLAPIGRHPLLWYVGHLVALVLVFGVQS